MLQYHFGTTRQKYGNDVVAFVRDVMLDIHDVGITYCNGGLSKCNSSGNLVCFFFVFFFLERGLRSIY